MSTATMPHKTKPLFSALFKTCSLIVFMWTVVALFPITKVKIQPTVLDDHKIATIKITESEMCQAQK